MMTAFVAEYPSVCVLRHPFFSSASDLPLHLALRRRRREQAASSVFRGMSFALRDALASLDDDDDIETAAYTSNSSLDALDDGRRVFPRKNKRKEVDEDALPEHVSTSMTAYTSCSNGPVRRTVRRYKDSTGRERFSEERCLGEKRCKVKWDSNEVDEDGSVKKLVETNFDHGDDGDRYTVDRFEEEWKGLHGKRALVEGAVAAEDTYAEVKETGNGACAHSDQPDGGGANHSAPRASTNGKANDTTDDVAVDVTATNGRSQLSAPPTDKGVGATGNTDDNQTVEQLEKEVDALKEKIAQLRGRCTPSRTLNDAAAM